MSQQRRNPFGPGGQLPSPRGGSLPGSRGPGVLPSPRSGGLTSPRGGEGGFMINNPYGTPGSRLSVASSTGSSRGSSPTPSEMSPSSIPGRGAVTMKGGIQSTIQQIKGKLMTFIVFCFTVLRFSSPVNLPTTVVWQLTQFCISKFYSRLTSGFTRRFCSFYLLVFR